jgi:cell division control protein 24
MTATSDSSDPHYDEVKTGTMAAKRIVDRISEAHRSAENDQTVKSLQHRIQDWKGHHLENFGDLLLHDFFVVTKSGIDREYHIFLFEKIMLCCKEAVPPFSDNNRGTNKSGSIFKKQSSPSLSSLPGGLGQRQKNTPLLLKGRIFLSNVTQTVPVSPRNSIGLNCFVYNFALSNSAIDSGIHSHSIHTHCLVERGRRA